MLGTAWFFPRSGQPPVTPASQPSIAILPLDNLGPPAQQYFADGVTEALTTQLAGIEALKVIARGAVMRFRDDRPPPSTVAQALGVSRLVEGSELLAGERVRVTARVVDGATDQTLWADSYEGDLQDILDLQARVARAIVNEIRVRMTSDEIQRLGAARPVEPGAYQAFLRGLYESERATALDEGMFANLARAIAYLESAVAQQPDWGTAHGSLAHAHLRTASMSDNHVQRLSHYRLARESAERAVALDPDVALAWIAPADLGPVPVLRPGTDRRSIVVSGSCTFSAGVTSM